MRERFSRGNQLTVTYCFRNVHNACFACMHVQVLASGEQPLLVEELSMLVRDVAMVDEVSYYYK
jgi:hypothetical protein